MTAEIKHFSDLTEYHQFLGLPAPEHPLFSILSIDSQEDNIVQCANFNTTFSSDFYSISLKHVTAGEIFYGRTKYDCKNGTMIFMSPQQEIHLTGL